MNPHQDILDFWFGDGNDDARRHRELWFAGSPDVDAMIRERFLPQVELAAAGKRDHWKNEAGSCLALILLLDQFPLNIFRNQARGYLLGDQALPIAQHLLDQGHDRHYTPRQRLFAYLPFEHSESLPHQELALQLFAAMKGESGMDSAYDYALRHWEIVKRFGRFPHRNDALGRISTPEEIEFLKQPGSRF